MRAVCPPVSLQQSEKSLWATRTRHQRQTRRITMAQAQMRLRQKGTTVEKPTKPTNWVTFSHLKLPQIVGTFLPHKIPRYYKLANMSEVGQDFLTLLNCFGMLVKPKTPISYFTVWLLTFYREIHKIHYISDLFFSLKNQILVQMYFY